jgi:hypothetical protein
MKRRSLTETLPPDLRDFVQAGTPKPLSLSKQTIETPSQPPPIESSDPAPSDAVLNPKPSRPRKPRSNTTRPEYSLRRSHSKGNAAAVVTGYLNDEHVQILLDLRERSSTNTLSIPSVNLLLKVALRLIKTLKPTDAQILDAVLKEQEGEG